MGRGEASSEDIGAKRPAHPQGELAGRPYPENDIEALEDAVDFLNELADKYEAEGFAGMASRVRDVRNYLDSMQQQL
jgi:hypothetical protein